MSSSIDYFECPKCGGSAFREQDNRTSEVRVSCQCGWKGETLEGDEDGLEFTCPKCGGHDLGSVEQVITTYPVTRIPTNGNLDYDYDRAEAGDGEVLAYQCMNCGYELKDEKENTITDCLQVPKWVKNHTKKG